MKKIAILFLFFFQEGFAQQVEGEIELAGFVLGQHKKTVYAQLGPPFQKSKKPSGWIYEFHKLKPDTSVYAVFKYRPSDTTMIYAIELVGNRYEEMHPFLGFKLGARKEQVNEVLGKFDKTDTVDSPPVVTQYYSNKDYSVDIDSKGHLYGIQIFGNILEDQPKTAPSIKNFKNAILTKNIDSLVMWLAPDVEVHKGGNVITYTLGARSELSNKESELVKCLLGETGSVWFAFAKEYANGTSESRLHPELNQMTSVDKFFDSNVIAEIVFRVHAGRWKVYEIIFR